MATLEELFEEFKKLPDWERFPMPEAFYEHFKIKKLQPASITEAVCYQPPPFESLNEKGKIEVRDPAPGGVREIKDYLQLPVEVKRLNEETEALEDYPAPDPKKVTWALPLEYRNETYEQMMSKMDSIDISQIFNKVTLKDCDDACTQQDSEQTK